jgi:predicted ATP-dependent serine protease
MQYVCQECAAIADVPLFVCTRCMGHHSFLPIVIPPFVAEVPDRAVRSARDLAGAQSSFLNLQGDVARVVGRLPTTLWSLGVYGPAGAGKSTLLLLLAAALERCLGPTLFVAVEEGFSTSMIEKLKRLEIRSAEIHIACLASPAAVLGAIEEVGAKVLMVDSLTASLFTIEDVARIQREANVAVVTTLHVTKQGAPRGSSSITHWSDVVVRIENGRWAREKSRFDALSEGEVLWTRSVSA